MTITIDRHVSLRRTTLEVIATAVVAFLASLPVFLPILGSLNVPWSAGDMTQVYAQNSLWQWWGYGFTTKYGFPYGMEANAFAGLDIIPNVVAHAINSVLGDPFVGMNLLLLLSFPLVAVLAYVAIRLVGLAGPVAIALGVSYTFIPFHFGRGLGHVYLALLFSLVTGVILALIVGSGRLSQWATALPSSARLTRLGLVAALLVVTAWSSLYYAVYTVLLLTAALVWRITRGDSLRRLAVAASPLLAMLVLIVLGLLPVLISRAAQEGAETLGLRDPMDSVKYAGNLAIALVPQPYDQFVPAYNDFVYRVFANLPPEESHLMSNFGTWVTTACLITFLVGAVTYFRSVNIRRSRDLVQESDDLRYATMPYLIYLLVTAVLFFIPWGLNYFVASLVTAQIRGWNRLVSVLLLLIILGAAAAIRQWRWPDRPAIAWSVAVVVLVVTILQAVLPWRAIYSYVAEIGRVKIDAARLYASETNSAIPGSCGVLALPLMYYPGDGPRPPAMDDYDHFIIGLTNDEKSLSYGAIRGTPASQWQEAFSGAPTASQIQELKMMGFCGIHVDTAGFEDAATVLGPLTSELGSPVAVSGDGRWQMYAIR